MKTVLLTMALAAPLFAADPLAAYYDNQLKGAEHDVVGLAEAMPAGKYDFAPTQGTFTGVRTFAQQVKHIATIMYMVSSAGLGQKPPVDIGAGENGPDAVKTKEQIVAYLKGAFANAHKAIALLNEKNQLESLQGPFGGPMPRLDTASMPTWHTFDHYGQMVVYGRMNGVIPPSSQQAPPPPPAAGKKK
jgi:DinB family protein